MGTTKAQKMERIRKATALVRGIREDKDITKEDLLQFLQPHISYGSIELDDVARAFFAERGKDLPAGVSVNG